MAYPLRLCLFSMSDLLLAINFGAWLQNRETKNKRERDGERTQCNSFIFHPIFCNLLYFEVMRCSFVRLIILITTRNELEVFIHGKLSYKRERE